jgi:P2 family phage contractile tail tube protein
MPAASHILKNFAVFVDGKGYVGQADEVQLPALNLVEEDFRAGGMDAPIGIEMGQEKMESTFAFSAFDKELLSKWGTAAEVPFTARGVTESFDGSSQAVIAQVRGKVKGLEHGAWQAGQKTANTFTVSVTYYKLTVDSVVVHEIDVLNMKRIVNGVDRLAAQRAALGV